MRCHCHVTKLCGHYSDYIILIIRSTDTERGLPDNHSSLRLDSGLGLVCDYNCHRQASNIMQAIIGAFAIKVVESSLNGHVRVGFSTV